MVFKALNLNISTNVALAYNYLLIQVFNQSKSRGLIINLNIYVMFNSNKVRFKLTFAIQNILVNIGKVVKFDHFSIC